MSSTAIDQLFQITSPTHSGRGSSRSGSAEGAPFRAHLDRAAEAAEPKLPATKNANVTARNKKDEPLDLQTGEQETSTTEQEQAAVTAESSESTTEATDEIQPEEEPTDEVTLSAAAEAQQAEASVHPEQVVSEEGVVETTLTDGQQQSAGQSSTQLTGATNDSAASTTGTEVVESEEALSGEGGVGETASDVGEVSVEAKVENSDAKTSLNPGTSQATVAAIVESEAKKSQSSTVSTSESTNAKQLLAGQQLSNDTSASLSESDAAESSPQTGTGRFEVPASTTSTSAINELAVATDAELALANLNNATEPNANAANASSSSTADTVAAAGRTLGNLLSGKASATTNATSESSTTEAPTVDRARFVQRVGGAIRSAQNRDGQIQLRLSPPELGTLRINIVMNEGVLTAHLETETAAARAVLLDNLPALRERLAEQEIRIEKFDVNVGREGQQQTDNSEADDRQSNNARSQMNQPSSRDQSPNLTTAESNPTHPITASGLDVRI